MRLSEGVMVGINMSERFTRTWNGYGGKQMALVVRTTTRETQQFDRKARRHEDVLWEAPSTTASQTQVPKQTYYEQF